MYTALLIPGSSSSNIQIAHKTCSASTEAAGAMNPERLETHLRT